MSEQDGRSPLEHALHDGEDHELLFAGPVPLPKEFIQIGEVTEGREIALMREGSREILHAKAWEHRME